MFLSLIHKNISIHNNIMADEIISCYSNDSEDDLISNTLQSVIREMNRCIITGDLYQCDIDSKMSDYVKKILRKAAKAYYNRNKQAKIDISKERIYAGNSLLYLKHLFYDTCHLI